MLTVLFVRARNGRGQEVRCGERCSGPAGWQAGRPERQVCTLARRPHPPPHTQPPCRSGYVDLAHRLAADEAGMAEVFARERRLLPQPGDLSCLNWATGALSSSPSPNFEVRRGAPRVRAPTVQMVRTGLDNC